MDRRTFLTIALAAASAPVHAAQPRPPRAIRRRVAYNGIELPDTWPPRRDPLSIDRVVVPPYLEHPPAVIPIDVGRQLFVDDFLVEECSLVRTPHTATYMPNNPILTPTTAWERYDDYADRTKTPPRPTAMPFSDAVLFDPADGLFKMWYQAGVGGTTAYAVSDDGIEWQRPTLDIVPDTNIVINLPRDSSTIWLDYAESDPSRRYKCAMFAGRERRIRRFVSADGLHWHDAGLAGPTGDRTTVFYNPFRRVWVFSIRDEGIRRPDGGKIAGRYRRYWETGRFDIEKTWTTIDRAPLWVGADSLDFRRPEFNVIPELYNLDCVAYESVLLGMFSMFRGEGRERYKPNDVCVGFSRDGFHWMRPSRKPFINVSERRGDWNWTNVQSAGGCCLVMGDRLFFYVSGRSGIPGQEYAGTAATGLATLRRDGFMSLDDAGESSTARSVTTRPPYA